MIDSHLRFDCHAKEVGSGSKGVQLPYTRPASRACSANRRLGSDSNVQYCRFQVGLLSRHAIWCTSCDFRCTAMSGEQLSQGRLPARRSNRRQTTSQVAPLAAIEWHRPTRWRRWRSRRWPPQRQRIWMTWSRQLFQFVLCGHPTPRCWTSQEREVSSRKFGIFRSRLRTFGTHYHPTLDPAVLWTPSNDNDTSRPICSDSLNLMPPAPLYLRTLWRYTNTV